MNRLLLILTLCMSLQVCAIREPANLYDSLGGETGIREISELFVLEIAYDDRVFDRFADSNVARFQEKIIEHFCMIADGPCIYTGDTMINTHAGMNISDAEFNAIVEDLIQAMDKAGTPIAAQNRLLARLAVLRPEIAGI